MDTNGNAVERCRITPTILEMANLPKRLWDAHSTEIPEEQRPYFREWADRWAYGRSPTDSLYLSGTEKSERIMSVLLVAIRKRGRSIYCVSSLDLVDRMEDRTEADRMMSVSCLAITRFGDQYRDKGGYIDSHFARILNHRFDEGLPTIVCGRYPFVELTKYCSPQVSECLIRGYVEVACL